MRAARGRQRGIAASLMLGTLSVLLAACSGSDGGGGTPLSAATFFQIQGRLTLTPLTPASSSVIPSPPTEQDFLLFVDPVARSVVSFFPAHLDRAAVTTDGVSFSVTGGFVVGLQGSCAGSEVYYSSFQFTVDGSAGALTGSAAGLATLGAGDIGFSYKAALTFTGTRDLTGPTMDLGTPVDPFHVPDLTASRPLPSDSIARLSSAGETIELLPLQTSLDLSLGFALPLAPLPRYATAYDVMVTDWQDLAGNPGAPLGPLTTRAAPRLVAREDFENPALLSGDGTVVDASVLPPITGQRSAVLAKGQSGLDPGFDSPHVSARLQVVPGSTVVRFAARPFGRFDTVFTSGITMEAGVPGGGVTTAVLPPTETTTPSTVQGPTGSLGLGDVRTIELPLPAGADSEVVVDLYSGAPESCGLPMPPVGYLIDDIRVE